MARRKRTYTALQKARALDLVRDHGLAYTTKATGIPTSTLQSWRDAAMRLGEWDGTPDGTATAATAAATAGRQAERERQREELLDVLLGTLSLPAARMVGQRLAEQAELDVRLHEAEEALHEAITTLEACTLPDDPADPTTPAEKEALAEARELARDRVQDARLVAAVYRGARIPVRDLVGVLTRAVNDQLALEGKATPYQEAPTIVFGADLPIPAQPPVLDLSAAPSQ